MSLRVYNTMTRTKEELVPLTPGEVRMYVCGVTPYDYSHIGHARSAIVFDVIRRYLEYRGFRVTTVRNYTDVEDKIIHRANKDGVSAAEIAERYIAAEEQDMETLGVLAPDVAPKATEHIPEMVALIEQLVAGGFAYAVDGDVYFEVRRFPPYGRLSGRNLDELLVGARVEVDERKRDPRDFALWKAAKPGEPSWPSPWGPGRPGWHIECSAMSRKYLGQPFDIHGGGEDLIFPHHECEIAQAEAGTGKMFARYWLHNAMLNLGSEKMSKSLGNTLTIREIVKRHEPDALRLWMLGSHYRKPIEFSEKSIQGASRSLASFHEHIALARTISAGETVSAFERLPDETPERFSSRLFGLIPDEYGPKPLVGTWLEKFERGMDDDFNTAEALAALSSLRAELRVVRNQITHVQGPKKSLIYLVRLLLTLSGVLGLFQTASRDEQMAPEVRSRIEILIASREEARSRRDWKRADGLRAEIEHLGFTVEDTPSGPRVTRKDA